MIQYALPYIMTVLDRHSAIEWRSSVVTPGYCEIYNTLKGLTAFESYPYTAPANLVDTFAGDRQCHWTTGH